jgi:cation diffusion facilitator family transporter
VSFLPAWREFARQLYTEVKDDQVSNGAAALAFYTTLAVFPAAIFGLSLLAYLPIPHLQQAIFELLYQLLPSTTADLFSGTVEDIVSERNTGLLSFGLLFAVWSASTGVYAVMQQLNVVYGVREGRSFLRLRVIALLLMLLYLALLVVTFTLVIFGGVLQDWIAKQLGWSDGLLLFFASFRWVVIAFALLCAMALIYRLGPSVTRPFRLLRPGNLVATAGFLVASLGFKLYVGNFANYDKMYGGLGAVIVLLLWLFIIGWVILIGGEINDLLDRQQPERERSRKRPPAKQGRAQPAGRGRGAVSIVVWGALAANVAIAVSKYIAAGSTGSSALLSEAIHSTADSGNELLLVLGSVLSRKPADRLHPFGRGQEIYFWGLIVALVLFGLGGGLSFYEGIQHVLDPHPIENAGWSYAVLGCALVFESASFALAAHTMHKIAKRRGLSFLAAAHRSHDPEHFVVLFEDAAAILGVLVAFIGVYASSSLGLQAADGIASILIGVILTAAALFLAYECRSLLLGESADPEKITAIRAIAGADPAVERVGRALTMYLGPEEILLNLELDFEDSLSAADVEAAVQRLERAIRAEHADVRRIFIEPTASD